MNFQIRFGRLKKSAKGGALIVMVAIVFAFVILSLARFAYIAAQTGLDRSVTMNKSLESIDIALANFVAHNKRLPCPADGRIASTAANAGIEMTFPSCNAQQHGVLPWQTLGLAEYLSKDPWGGRLTYRVDPALAAAAPLLMNMSLCDVSGTGSVAAGGACRTPTPTCVANPATCTAPATFLVGKGLDVWTGTGAWAARAQNRSNGTGAAYILISHGETGAGAYNERGIFQPGTLGAIPLIPPPGTQAAGNDELPHFANQVLTLPPTQNTTFRNASRDTSFSLTHFDDYISHPSIRSVLAQVALQERVH